MKATHSKRRRTSYAAEQKNTHISSKEASVKKRDTAKHGRTPNGDTRSACPTPVDNGERNLLIAMKAYELYERRGRTHGHDTEDWFQAEAIVNGQKDETGA